MDAYGVDCMDAYGCVWMYFMKLLGLWWSDEARELFAETAGVHAYVPLYKRSTLESGIYGNTRNTTLADSPSPFLCP